MSSHFNTICRTAICAVAGSCIWFTPPECFSQVKRDERLTDIMFEDPNLPGASQNLVLPGRLRRPWVAALNRPEPELQRTAADNIATAYGYGLKGWDVADRLTELLVDSETDSSVRRAAARALVAIDARQSAPVLLKVSQGSQSDVAQIAEPALAAWDFVPAREHWLARMEDPLVPLSRLRLAIDALGVCGERKAIEPLLKRVNDVAETATIRMSSARAVAQIDGAELASSAEKLATSELVFERLIAAELLSSTDNATARTVLAKLAVDSDETVAGIALRRLFEIDPKLVYKQVNKSIGRDDASIRRVIAETLVHHSSAESVSKLSTLLGDHNPGIRRYATDSLIKLADVETLRSKVVEAASKELASEDWRAIEQSAIIAGSLDIEAVGQKLIGLLSHRRIEVQWSSAWALRKILVEELFARMLEHAKQQADLVAAEQRPNVGWDVQVSQIFQAFGEARYQEAEPLMQRFVPKKMTYLDTQARAAAVWSLGYLYEGKSPEDLAKVLMERITDINSIPPEMSPFRDMCAVAIGRMNAKSQVKPLRQYSRGSGPAGRACRWAVSEMTGEPYKADPDQTVENIDWILTPIE